MCTKEHRQGEDAMDTDPRNLAKEIARKRQQEQDAKPRPPNADELKQRLSGQLAQKKAARQEQLKTLSHEEMRRQRAVRMAVGLAAALLALAVLGWWLGTAKARRERAAAAAEQRQRLMAAETFVVSVLKDYGKSGMAALGRAWDPQASDLVRAHGDIRIKAVENPAGVRIEDSFPGQEQDTCEVHCREENGSALTIRLRRKDATFQIIGIE